MNLLFRLVPLLWLLGAGCDAQNREAVSPETEPLASKTVVLRDCTAIVSALERLACFDERDGTPSLPYLSSGQPAESGEPRRLALPSIIDLVRNNEAGRTSLDESRFRISEMEDPILGQLQVVISAPALGVGEQRPYLAISCLSNITRLQLLVEQPLERNQIALRLLLDERPMTATKTPWQVLEVGTVVDAGRGLVAIEQLRQLNEGARLRLESDYLPFDGLLFDASGLKGLMERQREACHW